LSATFVARPEIVAEASARGMRAARCGEHRSYLLVEKYHRQLREELKQKPKEQVEKKN